MFKSPSKSWKAPKTWAIRCTNSIPKNEGHFVKMGAKFRWYFWRGELIPKKIESSVWNGELVVIDFRKLNLMNVPVQTFFWDVTCLPQTSHCLHISSRCLDACCFVSWDQQWNWPAQNVRLKHRNLHVEWTLYLNGIHMCEFFHFQTRFTRDAEIFTVDLLHSDRNYISPSAPIEALNSNLKRFRHCSSRKGFLEQKNTYLSGLKSLKKHFSHKSSKKEARFVETRPNLARKKQ